MSWYCMLLCTCNIMRVVLNKTGLLQLQIIHASFSCEIWREHNTALTYSYTMSIKIVFVILCSVTSLDRYAYTQWCHCWQKISAHACKQEIDYRHILKHAAENSLTYKKVTDKHDYMSHNLIKFSGILENSAIENYCIIIHFKLLWLTFSSCTTTDYSSFKSSFTKV